MTIPGEGIHVDPQTSVYALFGDPVFHSMGPAMHNSAFVCIGFNGIYLALRVSNIGAAISAMRSLDFKGASITIPHKVDVIAHLDDLDPIAEKIGAAAGNVCDIALVVTPGRIPTFIKGFKSTGASKTLKEFGSFKEAAKWFEDNKQEGDVILIENDLPDMYERIPKI